MWSCHHRAAPSISRHLKIQQKPDIRPKFKLVGLLVDNNRHISLDKKHALPQDKASNANYLLVAMQDSQASPTSGLRLGDRRAGPPT